MTSRVRTAEGELTTQRQWLGSTNEADKLSGVY